MSRCEDQLSYLELFCRLSNPDREQCMKEGKPFQTSLELTNKCYGSCNFCFAASDHTKGIFVDTERAIKFIDEVNELGIKRIGWIGGDPLLHPDWHKIISYSRDQGMSNQLGPNPMSISKSVAKKIVELNFDTVTEHIGSIDQEVYNTAYNNPASLGKKIQGYYNLLEAGLPPNKVMGCITLTKEIVKTAERTVDWFLDEMGAAYVQFCIFRSTGFAGNMPPEMRKQKEPGLSEVKHLYEYLAKKIGDDSILKTGTSDASKSYCKTYFAVKHDGRVIPCSHFEDYPAGNIYEESLVDIFCKNRDELLFNFEIKGYCGEECPNRDICFGCRANALRYAGDKQASDPKCWWNPANREYAWGDA